MGIAKKKKSQFREMTWNQVRKEFPDAYDSFDVVMEGCDFGEGEPERTEWEPYIDDSGVLNASCERQPVAGVAWNPKKEKWVDPNEMD